MTDTRWAYKVLELKPQWFGLKPQDIEAALTPQGALGWELVGVVQSGTATHLYLKRPL